MAIQFTDNHQTVIYDSVTERPIQGLSVFDSSDHADDFLAFYKSRWAAWNSEDPRLYGRVHKDCRKNTAAVNAEICVRWLKERVDEETGMVKPRSRPNG